jgi:hypothetical protein
VNGASDVAIRASGVAIRSEHFVAKKSEHFVAKKSEHFVAETSKMFVANKSENFVAKQSEHFVAKKSEHFVAKKSEHFVAKKSAQALLPCQVNAEKGGVRGCAPAPEGQKIFVSTLQDTACPSKSKLVLFLWSTRSGMTCVVGGWWFFY